MPPAEPASQSGQEESSARVALVSADRVVFFYHAVTAISLTRLALDLPVPQNTGLYGHDGLLHFLRGHFFAYLVFLLSFLVIARHWRTHHEYFDGVQRLDSRIITINLAWLLMIIVTPFATKVLISNINFELRFTFYAVVQILTGLTLLLMDRHIRVRNLPREPAERTQYRDYLGMTVFIVTFTISIPVVFLLPARFNGWAFAVWGSSAWVTRYVARRRARHS
jgi:uncharacterized membrane protein